MKKRFDNVYQFKITLQDIQPPIWRRIQVPETYTFYDLHVAIQDAMGWLDYHLYQFTALNPSHGFQEKIGIPDEELDIGVKPGWKTSITNYFTMTNKTAYYVYDFGDNWEHIVELEKILPRETNVIYPICIQGKRACPPEDCGGAWGYEDFLEIIMDPTHEQYEEMIEWVGGEFEPEAFNPEHVVFTDPDERRRSYDN